MKKFLIGLASIMMIGIMLATVIYQTNTQISKPELEQLEEKIQKEAKEPQLEKLMPIYEDASSGIGYSLQNDQLQITYDNGANWASVPIGKESLFSGEYTGNKEELIQNSYILTKDRALFLNTNYKLQYVISFDQGKTWQNSTITETYPFIRFRKIDFLSENFGYVIVSGDRTMSSEWSSIFITIDGGATWTETNRPDTTRLVADGGFVDEKTGFLSFGILNPEKPDLYVTQDGGISWNQAQITIPAEYDKIFVIAESPSKEENKLAMLINQGPNGDYLGGKIKGKFISTDNGLT
ncbi:MAG: oxidoreductase, partial [Bacillus sp. (in: firmicutes)]